MSHLHEQDEEHISCLLFPPFCCRVFLSPVKQLVQNTQLGVSGGPAASERLRLKSYRPWDAAEEQTTDRHLEAVWLETGWQKLSSLSQTHEEAAGWFTGQSGEPLQGPGLRAQTGNTRAWNKAPPPPPLLEQKQSRRWVTDCWRAELA